MKNITICYVLLCLIECTLCFYVPFIDQNFRKSKSRKQNFGYPNEIKKWLELGNLKSVKGSGKSIPSRQNSPVNHAFNKPIIGVNPVKFSTAKRNNRNNKNEIKYLVRYGYLSKTEKRNDDAVQKALKFFQNMWHLNDTGEFDEPTVKLMKEPRCGCKDVEIDVNSGKKRRIHKRFAIHPLGGWKTRNLTYRILPFINKMTLSFGRGGMGLSMPLMTKFQKKWAIHKAFRFWNRVSPLTFTEVKDNRPEVIPDTIVDDPFDNHIDVKFAAGYHGDVIPFDGKLGALGHAFWPAFGGDLHLDEAEMWAINKPLPAVDLYQVAVHELGHAIGLGHTNVWEAVMYPFYRLRPKMKISLDDLDGLKILYP